MFADWIAAGLDPERCTLFIQSHVKQHAELYLLLGMVAPLGWLERVPTYKEQQEQLKEKDLNTYGFLGYPLLQAADVAVYGADAVPVGQDQVSHLELAREIVRKFNFHFGTKEKPVLVEPHAYLTDVPKILGLDGRKMSKSYGNAVELGEDPESARKRIMVAVTDPARKRRHDPGHPEVCPIYWLHRAYSDPQRVELVDRECRSAGIGCVDCKKMLLEGLIPALEKHRAARAELDRHPGRVEELVQLGTKKAGAVAEQTMAAVRDAVKLS
jgi:tryptophanyl-tRNA synthetase